jgi:hypothetical protein
MVRYVFRKGSQLILLANLPFHSRNTLNVSQGVLQTPPPALGDADKAEPDTETRSPACGIEPARTTLHV